MDDGVLGRVPEPDVCAVPDDVALGEGIEHLDPGALGAVDEDARRARAREHLQRRAEIGAVARHAFGKGRQTQVGGLLHLAGERVLGCGRQKRQHFVGGLVGEVDRGARLGRHGDRADGDDHRRQHRRKPAPQP